MFVFQGAAVCDFDSLVVTDFFLINLKKYLTGLSLSLLSRLPFFPFLCFNYFLPCHPFYSLSLLSQSFPSLSSSLPFCPFLPRYTLLPFVLFSSHLSLCFPSLIFTSLTSPSLLSLLHTYTLLPFILFHSHLSLSFPSLIFPSLPSVSVLSFLRTIYILYFLFHY